MNRYYEDIYNSVWNDVNKATGKCVVTEACPLARPLLFVIGNVVELVQWVAVELGYEQ